jgi:hypothetical protein
MWKDTIVEQVRKNREKLFSEFNYDIKKFTEYIIQAEKNSKRKIVTLDEMRKLKENQPFVS